MSSKNISKRLHAERLYIDDGWTNKAIAQTVGVSENTIGTWAKKYAWKEKRDEAFAAPHKIRQLLLTELQRVAEGEKPKFNSDDLSKITRALERLDKGVSVQVIISVMKLFTDWLTTQELEPEQLISIVDLTKLFIKEQIDNE